MSRPADQPARYTGATGSAPHSGVARAEARDGEPSERALADVQGRARGNAASDVARDTAAGETDGFAALFERHVDGVLVLDGDGTIVDVNAAALRLLATRREALLGIPLPELFSVEQRAHVGERLAAALVDYAQRWEASVRFGDVARLVQLTVIPRLRDGRPHGSFCLLHDVTQERALAEQLAHQAFHDPLTGLANRALFRERVAQALARSGSGAGIAVLYVDLDDFKRVNDTLGHAAGDALLVRAAEILLECTRGVDAVARFGGDEFAVLLERVEQPADVQMVAARIGAALRRPLPVVGREVIVGASLGIALARPGVSADELLRDADLAMYRAKASGKGGVTTFESGMQIGDADRRLLREELERVLAGDPAAGRLSLAFQPIVDLATGRAVGCEALARWWSPTRGEVPPTVFFPLAEETGLVVALGRWVLHAACAQLRRWSLARPDGPIPTVSVNLSRAELEQPTLLRDVADALDTAGVDGTHLTLELPELAVMRRPDDALATLLGLRELGVGLALDDFGTGASSLGHLQRLPLDQLKIDRAFVRALPHDADAEGVVRTILAVGRALRVRTVAEGVEQDAQYRQLTALGCELGQGFLFARPGSADAMIATMPVLLADAPPRDESAAPARHRARTDEPSGDPEGSAHRSPP